MNEKEKIVNVRRGIEMRIERGQTWSSPKFNNAGFSIGVFFILITIFPIFFGAPINYFFSSASVVMILFGLWVFWTVPAIHLTNKSIKFQPLLTNLMHLYFKKKCITFDHIPKVTKFKGLPITVFIDLTPEEIVVNDILARVFAIFFVISFLFLLIGVYRDCKNKKRNENFSMMKFLFISFTSLFITILASASYAKFFLENISYFYPYYFTYIGIIIFLIPIYPFTKFLTKIFKLEFLVILSFFMLLFSLFAIGGIK
ncbi:MAG: hypothetical protein P1P85_03285 [Patescibacteria group bacterium]|nr:hypothetical protein [Patescibacteria group bacterium]